MKPYKGEPKRKNKRMKVIPYYNRMLSSHCFDRPKQFNSEMLEKIYFKLFSPDVQKMQGQWNQDDQNVCIEQLSKVEIFTQFQLQFTITPKMLAAIEHNNWHILSTITLKNCRINQISLSILVRITFEKQKAVNLSANPLN